MLTFLYWLIVLYLVLMTVWSLFRERKTMDQVNCVMVMIVLLLRLWGIK